jgi:putative ABC transport system substrate-binding protein
MKKAAVPSILVAVILLAVAVIADAQQPKKVRRIGYLSGSSPSANATRYEAFGQGLRELGYVEGKDILIEHRYAEGKLDRLPVLAAELFRLNVEVIVTGGPAVTRAVVKEARATIPIVMTQDPDPVGSGFVASLARPGGNITGLSTLSPEISGKRLELLKEIVPNFSRVAVLGTSTRRGTAQELKEVELAAGAFGVELQNLDVLDPKGIESAFRAASKSGADAVLMLASGGLIGPHQTTIIELAVKTRLPVIYGTNGRVFVEAGGLMTYGVNVNDLDRRAATYVDKILKGTKPGDIPVEQPKKFELVINLNAAKRIGLTIPPDVLARADRVIK